MLDANYWENRYQEETTGWDLGEVAPPLKAYFDQLKNRDLKILIPGGGNAYEAEYLFNLGFSQVYLADWAASPLQNFSKRVPQFPKAQLLLTNFFDINQSFDLIIEQTFFCAINPDLRPAYVKKMAEIVQPNGRLVGLLFNDQLNTDQPPYGGNKEEYTNLFSPSFNILQMEISPVSVLPRAGRELFFEMQPNT